MRMSNLQLPLRIHHFEDVSASQEENVLAAAVSKKTQQATYRLRILDEGARVMSGEQLMFIWI